MTLDEWNDEFYDDPKPTTACDHCGEEAIGEYETQDSCPTDRGEEIRRYSVPLCGECAARLER